MKITVGTSDRWSRSVLNDHSWKATTEEKRPMADALAHAEDPGRAEALSRILEDCIGSESGDGE